MDIDRPDDAHDGDLSVGGGLHRQGRAAGGATFARLEGAWHADGRIFITSTNGGEARMGQVWELTPGREELRLVYESPGAHELNMPDNLVVSPRGGLVICEDGTANPCLHVLTRDGRIARFARNNVVLAGERNGSVGRFPGQRDGRGDVQPRRPLAVRERADAGHHAGDHRAVGTRAGLTARMLGERRRLFRAAVQAELQLRPTHPETP